MNLNSVFLIGRLGQNPEIKNFENGKIAIVNVAVDSPYWSDEKGHWVSNPDWIRCVFSNKVATRAEETLSKGDEILVEGKIKVRKYEDKDGNNRTATEVKGLFKKNNKGEKKQADSSGQSNNVAQNSQQQTTQGQPEQQNWNNGLPEEDDLPF
mgnify:CR=1 FL=1